jgi:hypothetical protein
MMGEQLAVSKMKLKSEWWELTFQFRFQWLITLLAGGRNLSSVTLMLTELKASTSLREEKW